MSSVQSFCKAALTRLAVQPPSGQRHFIVVNQAALHGLNVASELHWRTQSVDILTGDAIDWSSGASPILMCAPAPGEFTGHLGEVWARFCDRWRFANALTVLTSALALDTLVIALRVRLDARLPEGLNVLLRWHDNRVMHALTSILDAGQMTALLAPATHWIWADRDGNACELSCSDASVDHTGLVPFQLTQHQEDQLLAAGEADALLDVLIRQDAPGLAGVAPPAQYRLITALLSTARGFGISGLSDQVAYCHLGISLGEGFHRDSPWTELLEGLQSSGTSLQSVLAAHLNAED